MFISIGDEVFTSLQAQFRERADPARAEAQRRYFKELIESESSQSRTTYPDLWPLGAGH